MANKTYNVELSSIENDNDGEYSELYGYRGGLTITSGDAWLDDDDLSWISGRYTKRVTAKTITIKSSYSGVKYVFDRVADKAADKAADTSGPYVEDDGLGDINFDDLLY